MLVPSIDQRGCVYYPRVLGVRVGQTLEIRNSDNLLHNVHSVTEHENQFNFGQARAGVVNTFKMKNEEIMMRLGCDVHRWMESYIGVLNHPFYSVSGTDGSFTIKGLPAGTYTIEAWHEKYGAQTANVTVTDGQAATNDFTFKAS